MEDELESKVVKGCKQLARNIEFLFHKNRDQRKSLRGIPLDQVTRVVPLLVVQDHILASPLVNWWTNKRFNELLHKAVLRPEVRVDSLSIVGIREMETMAESAEGGTFDFIGGLQYKCYADPDMRSNLHNFLLDCPGYGEGETDRIKAIIEQQFQETTEYLFGQKGKSAGAS